MLPPALRRSDFSSETQRRRDLVSAQALLILSAPLLLPAGSEDTFWRREKAANRRRMQNWDTKEGFILGFHLSGLPFSKSGDAVKRDYGGWLGSGSVTSLQIKDEVKGGLEFINHVYQIFGFTYDLKLSTDPWWNPAVEEQAIMRIHRIGQKRTVCVRRFIVKETVEERMQQVLRLKTEDDAGALTDYEVRSTRIEELKMLFR
nr:putative SWI/SNF-related matrix-associated actin-dependent regulator of chromatin subfamily A member 3-like 3 [Ipomoea batatas]